MVQPPYDAPQGDIGQASAPHCAADVILISCGKRKLAQRSQAKDLYTSPLFRLERAYAERQGVPWFVLSAKYGLVDPATTLDPYDLLLAAVPKPEREHWGEKVAADLETVVGPLHGKVLEIRAGRVYCDPIVSRLQTRGAKVEEPLQGLSIGRRLAWHSKPDLPKRPTRNPQPRQNHGSPVDPTSVVNDLSDHLRARTPTELFATDGDGLRSPGLYSWWADESGARDLSRGLGEIIDPGLIYAGQAGATRSRSGIRSRNTLWGRIRGMHLGGKQEFSTFRMSLASILTQADRTEISEARLTNWMHEHLRVITRPLDNPDELDALESAVLATLDPPLNLAKMPTTPMRARLRELRRKHRLSERP